MNKVNRPKLVILMGVSGSGKSTLAKRLAVGLSYHYVEADDFHTAQAKSMMNSGTPLTDEMRKPWIATICQRLQTHFNACENVVLAYSGLKAVHRHQFRNLGFNLHFILLQGDKALIASRLAKRNNHFASVALLDSQFKSMEAPTPAETDISILDIGDSTLKLLSHCRTTIENAMRHT